MCVLVSKTKKKEEYCGNRLIQQKKERRALNFLLYLNLPLFLSTLNTVLDGLGY